jgi:hypothetical protein
MIKRPHLNETSKRWLALLAMTILAGQIVDRTTGQPLTGVDVRLAGGANVAPARTNDAGQFTLRGVPPGHHTLTVTSDDVPPQTFDVVVKAAKLQHLNITACSTTLDYSCAAATP